MAYFIEHINKAINLDLVERIKFESDFHADEYSISFFFPEGSEQWRLSEDSFNKHRSEILRYNKSNQ